MPMIGASPAALRGRSHRGHCVNWTNRALMILAVRCYIGISTIMPIVPGVEIDQTKQAKVHRKGVNLWNLRSEPLRDRWESGGGD